ncbi:hypothetical protein TNCV_2752031 [Trichonephila clavipes]|nr:hypothetical protein TNCV_2752031 [Trichonephila clavipes]
MEACSLHPTSTTPSSRDITLVCAVGPDLLFVDDSAWRHRSVEISDTLQSENILCMQFPAYSVELNPIEHA